MIKWIFSVSLLLIAACQNTSSNPEIEGIHDKVMAIHDEVMPKMRDINQAKKKLRSIKNPEDSLDIAATIRQLDEADEGMMNWMAEFSRPSVADTSAAMTYYRNQLTAVQKVKDDMLGALSRAEQIVFKESIVMRTHLHFLLLSGLLYGFFACAPAPKTLPYIGDRLELNGDTLVHHIADFKFINQSGDTVTNATYQDKIYIVDFFFTSCPTICPRVKKQMLRIYDKVRDRPDVILVSHTIDPKRDNVDVLRTYATNLGVDHGRWHFLTGDKEALLDIADDYFVAAYEDPDVPGGFDHSGKILLLDKDGRIRSFCDGTDPESVDRFFKDIDILLQSYE